MKTILLIRHAKSEKDLQPNKDFERALTDQGKEDAILMAERIKDKKLIPDLLVSSPAKRAHGTASRMARKWAYPEEKIQWVESLYEAEFSKYYEVVDEIPDTCNSVAIVGHNPGIGVFADSLTAFIIDHFPTCAIAAFSIQTSSWKNFRASEKEFLFLDTP